VGHVVRKTCSTVTGMGDLNKEVQSLLQKDTQCENPAIRYQLYTSYLRPSCSTNRRESSLPNGRLLAKLAGTRVQTVALNVDYLPSKPPTGLQKPILKNDANVFPFTSSFQQNSTCHSLILTRQAFARHSHQKLTEAHTVHRTLRPML
jgi:hypothetical protein